MTTVRLVDQFDEKGGYLRTLLCVQEDLAFPEHSTEFNSLEDLQRAVESNAVAVNPYKSLLLVGKLIADAGGDINNVARGVSNLVEIDGNLQAVELPTKTGDRARLDVKLTGFDFVVTKEQL